MAGHCLAGSTRVPTFEPRSTPPHDARAVDTVTLDARDAELWRFYALGRGPLVLPDTAGWDIAVRRFRVIVAGAAARLDAIDFDTLAHPPTAGFVATTFDRDTLNPVLARWYRYSMFSHLLQPRGRCTSSARVPGGTSNWNS
jgi:hypothetical protein